MEQTIKEYNTEVKKCRDIFIKKTKDYGTAWRILRPMSLTDQLFIKGRRIRSIEETGAQKVNEGVDGEYIALVNYSVMAMIQMEVPESKGLELDTDYVTKLYDQYISDTRDLMIAKNHDYGEVWRDMRRSSLTDLILMKLLRVKQIEDNDGKTLISEGVKANYQDIINYSIFALIKITEKN